MKKPFAIVFGLSALALLDGLLAYSFPVDFQYQSMSIVWHFFFIGVIVFVHDKPWLTRVLISGLCGLLLDFLFNGSFPWDFLMYMLFGYLIGLFEPWLYRTKLAFLIYMTFCFLVDLLPWYVQKSFGITNIGFVSWFWHVELLTQLTNALAVIVIMYVDIVMVRFFLIQKHLAARESRKKMNRLKKQKSTPSS